MVDVTWLVMHTIINNTALMREGVLVSLYAGFPMPTLPLGHILSDHYHTSWSTVSLAANRLHSDQL